MPRFFERPYPNANAVLLEGDILVDPGTASDVASMRDWLGGVRPSMVVNTHWHTDHAGANAAFQAQGVPIALPAAEAVRINANDRDAGRTWWLHQRHTPFHADRALHPGERLGAWQIVSLPGHSASQVGFVDDGVLVCADALMDRDIGWIDLDADPAALDQTEATLDWIEAAGLHTALPGHGPVIRDVPAALARARRRLASWRADPSRIAWHASKRIFTHALLVEGGLDQAAIGAYLDASPWCHDIARRAFGLTVAGFAPHLVAEMLRAGAGRLAGERLVAA